MCVCVFMCICVQNSRAVFRYLSSGFLKISSVCAVYARDVTNVQKKRDECSGVIVVRTNSLRDETGCFWRDVCVCVCGEK